VTLDHSDKQRALTRQAVLFPLVFGPPIVAVTLYVGLATGHFGDSLGCMSCSRQRQQDLLQARAPTWFLWAAENSPAARARLPRVPMRLHEMATASAPASGHAFADRTEQPPPTQTLGAGRMQQGRLRPTTVRVSCEARAAASPRAPSRASPGMPRHPGRVGRDEAEARRIAVRSSGR
jgi:hypothetical protein